MPLRAVAFFLFLTRRARRAADALRDGPGVPSRDARPPAPRPAFRRAWLWKTSCSIFLSAGNPPSANLRLRCDDAHLFGSKARSPLQPGERTHTRMRWSTAAHVASRAGSLLSRAPHPALPRELHTLQSAPGCVAHTHTQWVAPRSWRTRLHRSYRTAHARRAPAQRRHGGVPARPRLPTASQLHGAPCAAHYLQRRPHTPAGQRVPSVRLVASLLCTCLSAASAPDQRPATAKLHHRTALQPAVRTPGLPMTHTGWLSRSSTASHAPNGL